MTKSPQTKIYLQDYTPPPYTIPTAQLDFLLDPTATQVTAQLFIKRTSSSKQPLVLNGINLQLQAIWLNEQQLTPAEYELNSEQLIIPNVPNNCYVKTVVSINPSTNHSCNGLYLTNGNFCTQCEPHGFRHITYFIDRPDVLTKFTTTITADIATYPVLLSNGNLIATTTISNKLKLVTWEDPFPKSAYLFALVAGKYAYIEDKFITQSKRAVTLRIYAEPNQATQCQHALTALKQAMRWDEITFNCEYDLDLYMIVAINDLNIGAMENKGLNIFNSSALLATPETATDQDHIRISATVAHEYFHNWTGNRITCRDWFQLGLKEGLTTLREQLFTEDTYGFAANRIESIKTMRSRQFAEDSSPLAHPVILDSYVEVNNFYTYTIYNKSAEIARMLRTLFGAAQFKKIITEFLQRYDGTAVTFDDFLATAAEITKTDLTQFKLWYTQAGTPKLNIRINSNPLTLIIEQQLPFPKQQSLHLPFKVSLNDVQGNHLLATTLVLQKQITRQNYPEINTKIVPSLLCEFSAPVKINYDYTDAELLFLMQHDADSINRWDATQLLLSKTLIEQQSIPDYLVNAFKQLLINPTSGAELTALLLQFPAENYLLQLQKINDIAAIHNKCEKFKLALAIALKNEFLNCYFLHHKIAPYNLDATAIANRSLKNICLEYLMLLNNAEITQICLKQLTSSNSLTDLLGALQPLLNSDYEFRDVVLNSYYQKWQGDQNLVNKWFALNANIKHPGTLQRIIKLLQYPAFKLQNPNNVYALLRTFSENNLVNFHQADGASYSFLAEQILAIDQFNPQLAATIANPLTRFHLHNPSRQQLMRQQLTEISQQNTISDNLREIVLKAIAS